MGGDATTHNILCSYVYLKINAPKYLNGIELQFYMIPTETSNFSIFLSRFDSWYGRYIYCTMKCVLKIYPTIVPKGNINESSMTKVKSWTNSELSTMQELHQNFLLKTHIASFPNSRQRTTHIGVETLDDMKYSHGGLNPTPSIILRSELENFFREAKRKLEVLLIFFIIIIYEKDQYI